MQVIDFLILQSLNEQNQVTLRVRYIVTIIMVITP